MKNKIKSSTGNAEEIVLVCANPTLETGFSAKAKVLEVIKDYGNGKRYCKVMMLDTDKICNVFVS